MRKLLFLSLFFGLLGCSALKERDYIKKDFNGVFKNTKVLDIKKSEIKGLWEVYLDGKDHVNIIYYYPDKKLLLFGEIWDVNGTSLTAERRERFLKLIKDKNK